MGQAASPSTGRHYGLARVCRVLEAPRSTVYAARTRRLAPVPPQKRGPKTAFTHQQGARSMMRPDCRISGFSIGQRARHPSRRTADPTR